MAELKGTHWHDTLMARRPASAPAAVDSLYQAPDLRVFQHILFGARANAPAADMAPPRKKAEAAWPGSKGGADSASWPSQLSEDPGSKADSGFLPAQPEGPVRAGLRQRGLVARRRAQMSGVVETPFGYHIIKRPDWRRCATGSTAYPGERAGSQARLDLHGQPGHANKIKVARVRRPPCEAAVENPRASRARNKKLVTFKGGELTVARLHPLGAGAAAAVRRPAASRPTTPCSRSSPGS